MYQIKLTPLAKAFAHKIGGEESLIARARIELSELIDEGCSAHSNGCPDIIMHTIMPLSPEGASDFEGQLFICTLEETDSEPSIIIDTGTYEEGEETLKEGPFKGYKFSIPCSDSSD